MHAHCRIIRPAPRFAEISNPTIVTWRRPQAAAGRGQWVGDNYFDGLHPDFNRLSHSDLDCRNAFFAIEDLVALAEAEAPVRSQETLSSWLGVAVERYSLASRDVFWTFVGKLRGHVYGIAQPSVEPVSVDGFATPFFVIDSMPRTAAVHGVLLDAGIDAAFREACQALEAVTDGQLQALLSGLAKHFRKKEPPRRKILRRLYRRLVEKLATIAVRLAACRSRPTRVWNATSTRERVLSFALWTGNPPPVGTAPQGSVVPRMSSYHTTGRGDQHEALRGRGRRGRGREGLLDRL